MGETCIKIDREKLAKRLSSSNATATAADVHLWLIKQGFTHKGGVWYCDGEAIKHLLPGEISAIVKADTIDHVTFVRRELATDEGFAERV